MNTQPVDRAAAACIRIGKLCRLWAPGRLASYSKQQGAAATWPLKRSRTGDDDGGGLKERSCAARLQLGPLHLRLRWEGDGLSVDGMMLGAE
eukprot:6820547-Prymnesium_polylepis.1